MIDPAKWGQDSDVTVKSIETCPIRGSNSEQREGRRVGFTWRRETETQKEINNNGNKYSHHKKNKKQRKKRMVHGQFTLSMHIRTLSDIARLSNWNVAKACKCSAHAGDLNKTQQHLLFPHLKNQSSSPLISSFPPRFSLCFLNRSVFNSRAYPAQDTSTLKHSVPVAEVSKSQQR